jgi:hypothetical protein
MIVVIGSPAYADSPDGEKCAGGLAFEVAAAATRRGSAVELVGMVGNDGAGDAVVVALGRLGIGHATLLRHPLLSTPVLVPAGVDDEAAELDADTPQAKLLPEDPSQRPALEAADVSMALRFLPAAGVIVLADQLGAAAVAAAVEGAAYGAARLIAIATAGEAPAGLPPEATVLVAPPDDDGSFGRLVGLFAGGLDAGLDPGVAFKEAVADAGWEPVAD